MQWWHEQYEMVQMSLAGWLKPPAAKAVEDASPIERSVTTVVRDIASDGSIKDDGRDNLTISDERGKHEPQNGQDVVLSDEQAPVLYHELKLPPQATITSITAETLPSFRRMVTILLPVPYPDKFYNDILNDSIAASISLIALWSDNPSTAPRVVAGIRCRLISHPAETSPLPSLYISTITTLAPFRGHGLAMALLKAVTRTAIEEYGIGTVTAHMWEKHEDDAGGWYEKCGFRRIRFEAGYYRKLKPGGAWLFEKVVGPSDLLPSSGAG